jgi:hypothetical protein
MTSRVLLLTVLVACSDDPRPPLIDAAPPDTTDAASDTAPPPDDTPPRIDLTCLGDPAPATAPDPLPIAGKAFAIDHYDAQALANATVELRARSGDALIASTASGADGAFAFAVASKGVPVDATLVVVAAGYRTVRGIPAEPFHGTTPDALLAVATDEELARWYADAGAASYTPGAPTLITATIDCTGRAIDGATLAVAPAAETLTYYDARAKRWQPTLTASTNGFALITGAATAITATPAASGTQLPARGLVVAPGVLTLAVLSPRQP